MKENEIEMSMALDADWKQCRIFLHVELLISGDSFSAAVNFIVYM